MDNPPPPPVPPPVAASPRRKLFKRPAWATPTNATPPDGGDDDIFNRSRRSLETMESQRKLEREREARHAAKERVKAETATPTHKRRRVDENETETQTIKSPSERSNGVTSFDSGYRSSPAHKTKESKTTPSKADKKDPTQRITINLDDSDDEPATKPSTRSKLSNTTSPSGTHPPIDTADADSDAEYNRLVREAEERKRRREAEAASLTAASTASTSAANPLDEKNIKSASNPPIQILVWSELPDTSPVIFNRLLCQPLKQVRLAWCQWNKFDEAKSNTIFLRWRKKRVFDISTCKSLGIDVDASGEVYIRNELQVRGEEASQIEMEAVNYEMVAAEKKAEEEEAERKARGDTLLPTLPEEPQPPPEIRIRVMLRAKGHTDLKLRVKPTTPIQQILDVYKIRTEIDAPTVFLIFDGEKLDPESTVQDHDIGDMDYIDVHVKS